MDYEDFKELASKNQLPDVTRDEFDLVAQKFPRLHAAAWIRFIKQSRKQANRGSGNDSNVDKTNWERKGPEIAFVLGGRDFTPGIHINDAWAQWLSCYNPADGMFEVLNRGSFAGQHGRKHELHMERADPTKSWTVTAWGEAEKAGKPNPVLTLADGIKMERLPWKDINELANFTLVEGQRLVMAVMGKVVFVKGIADRSKPKAPVEGRDFDAHPNFRINHGAHPTCEVWIGGKGALLKVRFGPYNHAVPLTNLPEWDLNMVDDLEDMNNLLKDQTVGVIGEVGYFKNTDRHGNPLTDNRGESQTHVFMDGTAILALDGDAPSTAAETPVPATKTDSSTRDTPGASGASAPAQNAASDDGMADAFVKLKGLVKNALGQIGQQATVEAVRQSHIKPEDYPEYTDQNVQMCMDLVRKEMEVGGQAVATPKATKALAGQIQDLLTRRQWMTTTDIKSFFTGKEVAGQPVSMEMVVGAIAYACEEMWIKRDLGSNTPAYELVE